MLCRDWATARPWPSWPKPEQPDFSHCRPKVKEVIRGAGLRDELSFASFRHGGFTEPATPVTERRSWRRTTPVVEGPAEIRQAQERSGRRRRARSGVRLEQKATQLASNRSMTRIEKKCSRLENMERVKGIEPRIRLGRLLLYH